MINKKDSLRIHLSENFEEDTKKQSNHGIKVRNVSCKETFGCGRTTKLLEKRMETLKNVLLEDLESQLSGYKNNISKYDSKKTDSLIGLKVTPRLEFSDEGSNEKLETNKIEIKHVPKTIRKSNNSVITTTETSNYLIDIYEELNRLGTTIKPIFSKNINEHCINGPQTKYVFTNIARGSSITHPPNDIIDEHNLVKPYAHKLIQNYAKNPTSKRNQNILNENKITIKEANDKRNKIRQFTEKQNKTSCSNSNNKITNLNLLNNPIASKSLVALRNVSPVKNSTKHNSKSIGPPKSNKVYEIMSNRIDIDVLTRGRERAASNFPQNIHLNNRDLIKTKRENKASKSSQNPKNNAKINIEPQFHSLTSIADGRANFIEKQMENLRKEVSQPYSKHEITNEQVTDINKIKVKTVTRVSVKRDSNYVAVNGRVKMNLEPLTQNPTQNSYLQNNKISTNRSYVPTNDDCSSLSHTSNMTYVPNIPVTSHKYTSKTAQKIPSPSKHNHIVQDLINKSEPISQQSGSGKNFTRSLNNSNRQRPVPRQRQIMKLRHVLDRELEQEEKPMILTKNTCTIGTKKQNMQISSGNYLSSYMQTNYNIIIGKDKKKRSIINPGLVDVRLSKRVRFNTNEDEKRNKATRTSSEKHFDYNPDSAVML